MGTKWNWPSIIAWTLTAQFVFAKFVGIFEYGWLYTAAPIAGFLVLAVLSVGAEIIRKKYQWDH